MKTQVHSFIQKTALILLLYHAFVFPVKAQIAEGQEKFLGNTHYQGQTPLNFDKYWNQVTPANSGKWASCEQNIDDFSYWTWLDRAYNYAREKGYLFKEHTMIWGHSSGEPSWVSSLPADEQKQQVIEWFEAFSERYPDVEMVDVVNEPLHDPPSYKDAIGGDGSTGWDWVIWCYEQARTYFPNAILILNEYNILNYTNENARFLELVDLLQARDLIDAIGCQAHSLENIPMSTIQANLEALAATGLPLYISEYEVRGDDATQLAIYQEQFPFFWEHPSVKGITLWGYVENEMWRNEAYLLSSEGVERPALQWLRSYISGDSTLTYQLSVNAGSNGSVSVSPDQSAYASGTQITVTATPDEGYAFEEWSGDLSSTSNPFTFNIVQDTYLEAVFTEETADTTDTPCPNPVEISIPFSFDGAGEFCWMTEGSVSYINSWNLETLEINGTDFTNTWSASLPETINGKYYISYTGLYAWSHFEITTPLKSTTIPKAKKEIPKKDSSVITQSTQASTEKLAGHRSFAAPKVTISNNKFTIAGNEIWFNGINTPWHLFDDFGRTDFNPQWWAEEFQRYTDNHINLARVWIHGSGEISPDIDETGYVSGASDLFWQHMDTLMAVSRNNKVYVLPALLSFDITKNTYPTHERWRAFLQNPDNIQSYIDNVLIPLVQQYEDEPYLLGWEICNEPEWMFENTEHGPQAFEDVQRMHAMLAAAIHENSSAYVTTGSAAPKWNSPIYDSWGDYEGNMFSDEALSVIINNSDAYLDFYQYHWYAWQTEWMDSPFTMSTAEYQVDDRPVIVGESEGNDVCDNYICQTIPEMYENAYLNGFDGVCAWKTPQNDGHGTFENIAVATNAFYNDHPGLVYPPTDTIAVEGIDLAEDSLSIEVNDVYTLSVTITPSNASNQNISWSSSDSLVAIVSEGSVTGVSEGTSLITATTEDGGYTDFCFITVLPDTPDPTYSLTVTSDGNGTVSVEPQDSIYEEGTVVTLTAIPNAGFKFSFWSGDLNSESSVVSIIMDDNKTITANFAELTTPCEDPVTITIPFSFDGAGDYCWVTDQTPSFINCWNLDLLEINNVDYTNSWASSFPDPVEGYYYIHYIGSYAWSHFEAPQAKSTGTTTLKKNGKEKGTVIFPNPFNEAINISIPDYNNVKKIIITDLSGRVVETIHPGSEKVSTGNNLPSGTYLVIIHYAQQSNVYKITKQ